MSLDGRVADPPYRGRYVTRRLCFTTIQRHTLLRREGLLHDLLASCLDLLSFLSVLQATKCWAKAWDHCTGICSGGDIKLVIFGQRYS